MQQPFHRIRRLPPYVFAEVNRLKASRALREETSSTSAWATPNATPKHIVEKLVETVAMAARTATLRRAVFPVCGGPSRTIMRAASV